MTNSKKEAKIPADTFTINTDEATNPGENMHNKWLDRGIAVLSKYDSDFDKLAKPPPGTKLIMWASGIGGVAVGKFIDSEVIRVTRAEDLVSDKEEREFQRKVHWFIDLRENPITAPEFKNLTGAHPNGRLRAVDKGKEEVLALIYSRSHSVANEPLENRAAKFAERETRPEQRVFRERVFITCAGRCIVSGCEVGEAMDAAHKKGRDWRLGHNSSNDGFLIRKDLHSLYDNDLLWFDNSGKVKLAPNLHSHYAEYENVLVPLARCK